MNDEKQQAFWVGTFVALSLFVLAVILIWKSQFWLQITGLKVYIRFDNANGIVTGSDVRYRGYTVGRVSGINPTAEKIVVRIIINKAVKIPKTSQAKILFDGIIGENYIAILPYQENKTLLRSGDVIEGQASYGVANFVDMASENLNELKEILSSLRQTFGDREVASAIRSTLKNLGALSTQLEAIVSELQENDIANEIGNVVQNLSKISTRLEGSLDEDFAKNTGKTMDNLAYITKELRSVLESPGFKKNITSSVERGANLIRGSENIIETLADIRVKAGMIADFSTKNSDYNYRLNADFWYKDNFLRFGLGNRLNKEKVINIQQSFAIMKSLRSRIGFFNQKFGVGFDYSFDPFLLELDVYDFDETRLDVALSFPVYKRLLWLRGGAAYIDDRKSSAFAGISIQP